MRWTQVALARRLLVSRRRIRAYLAMKLPRPVSVWAPALVLGVASAAAYPRGVEHAKILSEAGDVDKSYDYIVVGGGTSGLTVADRLTEDPTVSVLVVEYGELGMFRSLRG